MKGPGMRLDLDVRRLWRCTVCGTERHTSGRRTLVRCHFCKEHPAMTLVEHQRPQRDPPPPLDLIFELHPEDVDAAPFVPVHLRESEPTPPVETMDEILAGPPPAVEDPAPSQEVLPAQTSEPTSGQGETESGQGEADTSTGPPADEQQPGKRKKKRRSRRQRRRNRSSKSEAEDGSVQQAEGKPPSPSGAANPGDSFGSGVVP